jgi:hypothetical protein
MEKNNELEMPMDKLGYAKEDVPEEFLNETPDEEVHYILKDGESMKDCAISSLTLFFMQFTVL